MLCMMHVHILTCIWHGYVFDEDAPMNWNGQLSSIDEMLMNCMDEQIDQVNIDDFLNYKTFEDTCHPCIEDYLND